jgi:hypothetical protein
MRILEYELGDLVRCSGAFTNAAGTAIDPASVLFSYRRGTGTVTILTYGVDVALVKDSTGNYHVDIDANAVGLWHYRFHSTGSGQAADEHTFKVRSSNFD